MGNGGSVRDPYFTLRPLPQPLRPAHRHGYSIFLALAQRGLRPLGRSHGQIAPDDPALVPLFRQALEIWLAELPAIPLLQWFHRIPHNQTYWTNWPSAENPYMNSAYWVRSFLIVLLGLEPTQP